MPKYTTSGEDAIYDNSESEVQAIIDKLDLMIEERDTEIEEKNAQIAELKNELAEVRSQKDQEIDSLKDELRNKQDYNP